MESNYSSYQNGGQNKEQDFQKLSQTIATSIQKISQNVSSMQRMVNQIGTHQDSPELRKQLHSIQHYTQQLVKDTNGYIKDLSMPTSMSQSEQRQRKMQRERLQDEFTATLNAFQQVQRSTAAKEKDQINKAKAQIYGEHHLPGYKSKDQQLIELQDNHSKQVQIQEEADLRALQEQEQSIRHGVLKRSAKSASPVFVIKSKDTYSNTDVMKSLIQHVNLADLKICVNGTKKNRGGAAVYCNSESDLEKLHEVVKSKFVNFDINPARKVNPRLFIKNLSRADLEDDDSFLKTIASLNDLEDCSGLKVITKLKRRNEYDLVLDAPPLVHKMFTNRSYIRLTWKRCSVFNHTHIVQCYRCSSFGHLSKNCKNEPSCFKCSGTYEARHCSSTVLHITKNLGRHWQQIIKQIIINVICTKTMLVAYSAG
nr:unnamed protein product [Callosobruchus analis]